MQSSQIQEVERVICSLVNDDLRNLVVLLYARSHFAYPTSDKVGENITLRKVIAHLKSTYYGKGTVLDWVVGIYGVVRVDWI